MSSYGNLNRPRDYKNEELQEKDISYSKGDFNTATCITKDCVRKQNEQPLTTPGQSSCNLPKKFEQPHFFSGYGCQNTNQNPFYKTTSSDYGWFPPGIHTVPSDYFPKGQKFTSFLAKSGMYRNYSLNTGPVQHMFGNL